MQTKRNWLSWRALPVLLAGILAGSVLITPGVAHVTKKVKHLYKHLDKRYVKQGATVTNATNADKLDGKDAAQLESDGFIARTEGFVTVPASSTTTVQSLSLPGGNYLIWARGSVNSNQGAAGDNIDCTLAAGTTSQTIDNFFLNANLQPGETEETPFMIAHAFAAPGAATLSCTTAAGWAGNIIDPTIAAISVQDLTASQVPRALPGLND